MLDAVSRFSLVAICLSLSAFAAGGDFRVGWAGVEVTPSMPVALGGQMQTRISKSVRDPLTATALAIECVENGKSLDHAVMISLDSAGRSAILEGVRTRLAGKIDGLDPRKIVLHSTHTHTAAETEEGIYRVPATGIMTIAAYRDFLIGRLAEAVRTAWENRQPARVSWGMGHAVIGHNRRAVYMDGTSRMYGSTAQPGFSHLEGYENHTLQCLFFRDSQNRITGIGVLVPCPSQEIEGESFVSADFWAEARAELRKTYGKELFVYPMTGAAGDQSPHLLLRKASEDRARERRGLTRTGEIARRIAAGVAEALEGATAPIASGAFAHRAGEIPLPHWKVTESEAEAARRELARLEALPESDRTAQFHIYQQKSIVNRFERQRSEPYYRAEVHVIRLGDIAIATNPFELYLDYGVRIEARSRAQQTFVVQLAPGSGGYLPTRRAVEGGGYGAVATGSEVGPEGGQVLVDRTLEWIDSLWEAKP